MIFIGGVGPRRKRLEDQPRICSNCGLGQAYLTRFDNYFSLFFVPILRLRKGQPIVLCERCGHATDEIGNVFVTDRDLQADRCLGCGESLAKDYSYCPYCGKRL